MKSASNNFSVVRMDSRRFSHRGVTLIELMVVIVIIGLLSGLIAPEVIQYIARAKVETAKAQVKHLHDAVRNYYIDTEEYPQSLDDLVIEPSGVTGWNREGYLEQATEVPLDPWGNEFEYIYPGSKYTYDIVCYGRDGQEGGADEDTDIFNSDLGRSNTGTGGPGH